MVTRQRTPSTIWPFNRQGTSDSHRLLAWGHHDSRKHNGGGEALDGSTRGVRRSYSEGEQTGLWNANYLPLPFESATLDYSDPTPSHPSLYGYRPPSLCVYSTCTPDV